MALSGALSRARSGRRVSSILILYLVVSAAIAYRLVGVQVVSADEYRDLGIRQTQRVIDLPARRGAITDREGQPLAMSLTASTVYVNPEILAEAGANVDDVAAQLAGLLADQGVDAATIRDHLTDERPFVFIKRQVPREVGQRIADLELPGIGVIDEPTRTYPADPLASPLLGTANIDGVGTSGLEAEYDEVLTGTPGTLHFERAARSGLEIAAAPRQTLPPVPGTDVVLTLNREIQAAAEAALAEAVSAAKAEGGAAVVLDVRSGEILALASAAGVNPSTHMRAITDIYEPGSVNKVITLAGALEEGLVTPVTDVEVPRVHTVGGKAFSEAHPPDDGTYTVAEIMVRSSNVGTIRIAELLGPDRLHEYLGRFGYGRTTGLDFPGETPGLLPDPSAWSATSLPTMAIGHGVSATLLQVAGIYATIANDGEWVQPSLVRGTAEGDAAFVASDPPERRRVVSTGTAESVAAMLAGVVDDEEGTGSRAAVPGYTVAGKTGTARKPLDGGYKPGAYIASFAGFAPAEDPRFVVAVMVDEPHEGSYYGGTVAAPVFSEIMGFALGHERVPPSPGRERPTPEAAAPPPPPSTPAPAP